MRRRSRTLIVLCGLTLAALSALPAASAGEPRTLSDAVRAHQDNPAGTTSVCTRNVRLWSEATGVAVYMDREKTGVDTGMLRAWWQFPPAPVDELFTVCTDDYNVTTLQNQTNGLLVSAEVSWGGSSYGVLRARNGSVGPWERFRLEYCGGTCVAIRSLANNALVSVELDSGNFPRPYTGVLRARADTVGPWERFR